MKNSNIVCPSLNSWPGVSEANTVSDSLMNPNVDSCWKEIIA